MAKCGCDAKMPWGKVALLSAGVTIVVPVVLGLFGVVLGAIASNSTQSLRQQRRVPLP